MKVNLPAVIEPEVTQAVPYAPWFSDDAQAFAFVSTRAAEPLTLGEALDDAMDGGITRSGIHVGPEGALRISAALACRRVISEDIAKLPFRVIRIEHDPKTGHNKTLVQPNHRVHKLLTQGPNDWMTPFQFIEYMVGVAMFHEGAYALVQRDAEGNITELLPLPPGCCGEEVDALWQVRYRVSGYGFQLLLEPDQILSLHGHMRDPWRGIATISLAREAVALAAAIEASQARFHANDLRPSGVLTSKDTKITPETRDAIKQQWQRQYSPGGEGGIAVLSGDWDFKPMTLEGAKSEVVENRKFQINEICRFFRVFPLMIGHNDGSQSFASVESFFTAHAQHSLQPWVLRVEQSFTTSLLTKEEIAQGYRVDIDMDAALRGTPTERVGFYEKATKIFMTPNEVRVREGMDPLDDAEMDRVMIMRNNTGTSPAPLPPREKATHPPGGE